MRKEIGDCNDIRCKQNSYKRITEKTCRNNCKYFKYDKGYNKRTCLLGYRNIRPRKTSDSKKES